MGKRPPKWLTANGGARVDETVLLQRRTVEQLRADKVLKNKQSDADNSGREKLRKKLEIKKVKKLATKRFITAQAILHTAEKRVKNTRRFAKAGEKFDTRLEHREDKAPQTYKNARVALVIRAKGKMLPEEVKDGFGELGLSKLYTARLLLLTPEVHRTILQLQRFAIVGYPDRDQLEQLLRSRGSIYNKNEAHGLHKTLISGNLVVENAFAQSHNVFTIEELADAVFSKGKNVASLLRRVAPFDLHPPRQMFFERNRSVHEKLEVLNEDSFAALLSANMERKATAAKKNNINNNNSTNSATAAASSSGGGGSGVASAAVASKATAANVQQQQQQQQNQNQNQSAKSTSKLSGARRDRD